MSAEWKAAEITRLLCERAKLVNPIDRIAFDNVWIGGLPRGVLYVDVRQPTDEHREWLAATLALAVRPEVQAIGRARHPRCEPCDGPCLIYRPVDAGGGRGRLSR